MEMICMSAMLATWSAPLRVFDWLEFESRKFELTMINKYLRQTKIF